MTVKQAPIIDHPICIYHANCADGFGAAWVVRKAFSELNVKIDFYAAEYNNPPPDVTGRDVIMVDFSYKRPVLLEMAEKANHILIIDHHKSAIEELVNLPPNVKTVFDVSRSGAMLAFDFYFPRLTVPQLIFHIQDRDLWLFNHLWTKEVMAFVLSHPYDFGVWDGLMSMSSTDMQELGSHILRKYTKDLNDILRGAVRKLNIVGYVVPAANVPHIYASDAGYIMASEEGVPFSACYRDTGKGREFSLRSSKEFGIDVSHIAKQFGGGGHHNAAGFTVSFEDSFEFEIE